MLYYFVSKNVIQFRDDLISQIPRSASWEYQSGHCSTRSWPVPAGRLPCLMVWSSCHVVMVDITFVIYFMVMAMVLTMMFPHVNQVPGNSFRLEPRDMTSPQWRRRQSVRQKVFGASWQWPCPLWARIHAQNFMVQVLQSKCSVFGHVPYWRVRDPPLLF